MKHNLELKTNIHNRFDIEVKDVRTGEVREKYQAENIVLNQMWTRLCGRSTYFVNIHFGTGSGTLSAARTSLFTHLGTKAAANDAMSKALPTSWWRRKIVLNPEEYVGSELTEVGVAYGSTNTNLVTHAQIRDMNGNVTSIAKTAYDVVTIYATVFVTFSTSNSQLALVGLPNSNALINYLIGGTAFPGCSFFTGQATLSNYADCARAVIDNPLMTTAYVSFTSDAANKRFYTNVLRIAIGESNGHIAEVGFGNSVTVPISRLVLPATGIYSGLELVGVPIGTGDGTTTAFNLPSNNVDASSVVVKVDGVAVSPTITPFNAGPNFALRTLPISFDVRANISSDGLVFAGIDRGGANPNYWDRFSIYEFVDDVMILRHQESMSGNGIMTSVAVSSDGDLVVLGLSVSPYLLTYKRNGNAWVKETNNFTSPPSAGVYAVAISGNDLVIGSTSGARSTTKVYDWNGTSSLWEPRAVPTSGPTASYMNFLSLDYDGSTLMATHAYFEETGVYVWDWSGSAWVGRSSVPEGTAQAHSASISADGLTICYTRSGLASVWDWSGSEWTKRANAPDRPSATYHNASISADGLILVNGRRIYDWSGSEWIPRNAGRTEPPIIENPQIARVAKNKIISSSSSTSSYNTILDIANRNLKAVFTTPPADGAVITADYTVNGIHKTTQRVVDLQATIQFGEPT